ncbi:hypothetical protein KEM54_005223 [Ascosphaera aggregata]|nr:hypothetical protein KEM54_005223 [Ascosphaera aggregata]
MDVTQCSFNRLLPRLLNEIIECRFVVLDLELSGIAGKERCSSNNNDIINVTTTKSPPSSYEKRNNRDLQSRYVEVKAAAEKFTVLQIGLTFIREEEDEEMNAGTGDTTATFALRPYNLHLNPILDSRLEIEREWGSQSTSLEFLLRNGFQVDLLFRTGVRYLSRDEESKAFAIQAGRERMKTTAQDINHDELTPADVTFITEVKSMIDDWVASQQEDDYYLNIPPPRVPAHKKDAMPEVLNGFQKRLVHQIVRRHYPDYVSTGKDTFVQIVALDEKRERLIKESRREYVRERILDHVGFRWVIEALVGGDLSSLRFTDDFNGEKGEEEDNDDDDDDDEERLSEEDLLALKQTIMSKLNMRRSPPILVGHNIFVDLVNLYKCFIGELPPTVEEFQRKIHALFPNVVDTKYLATHSDQANAQNSSLRDIIKSFERFPDDFITIDKAHVKYNLNKTQHEAGYDSLVTAKAFLKLVTRLYKKEKGKKEKSYGSNVRVTASSSTRVFPGETQSQIERPDWALTPPADLRTSNGDILEKKSVLWEATNESQPDDSIISTLRQLDSRRPSTTSSNNSAINNNKSDHDEGTLPCETEELTKSHIHTGDATKDSVSLVEDDLIELESLRSTAHLSHTDTSLQGEATQLALFPTKEDVGVDTEENSLGSLNQLQHRVDSPTINSRLAQNASFAFQDGFSQRQQQQQPADKSSSITLPSRMSQPASTSTVATKPYRKPVWESNDGLGWGIPSTTANAISGAVAASASPMKQQFDNTSTHNLMDAQDCWQEGAWRGMDESQNLQTEWDEIGVVGSEFRSFKNGLSEYSTSGEKPGQMRRDGHDGCYHGPDADISGSLALTNYNYPTTASQRSGSRSHGRTGADSEPASNQSNQSVVDRAESSQWGSSSGMIYIPTIYDPFWRMYVNKLRVYGTEEEIFDLGDLYCLEDDEDVDDEEEEEEEDVNADRYGYGFTAEDEDKEESDEAESNRDKLAENKYGNGKSAKDLSQSRFTSASSLSNILTKVARPTVPTGWYTDDLWLER